MNRITTQRPPSVAAYRGHQRLRSVLIAILLVVFALPAVAASYNLWIDGTQVTDSKLKFSKGINTITYTPKTNTLTIEGTGSTDFLENTESLWWNITSVSGIKSQISGLKILIKDLVRMRIGYYTGSENYCSAFDLQAPTTIEGYYGQPNSANNIVIMPKKSSNCSALLTGINFTKDLEIRNIYVNVACDDYGLQGGDWKAGNTVSDMTFALYGAFTGNLTIHNSFVAAYSSSNVIYGMASKPTITGCNITSPQGATFTSLKILGTTKTYWSAVDSTGRGLSKINISPTCYGLKINYADVTEGNKDNIFGFKYDPTSKTLDLNNVDICNETIYDNSMATIQSSVDGLKITGKCKYSNKYNRFLYLEAPTTLSGADITYTITDTTANFRAIELSGKGTLSISNSTLNIYVDGYGILDRTENGSTLYLNNSTININGTDTQNPNKNPLISGFSSVYEVGCGVEKPDSAVWASYNNRMYLLKGGKPVTDKVAIMPSACYDIRIGDILIDKANRNVLNELDAVKSGKVRYIPEDEVYSYPYNPQLKLENAVIDYTDPSPLAISFDGAICFEGSGTTELHVKGKCRVRGTNIAAISSQGGNIDIYGNDNEINDKHTLELTGNYGSFKFWSNEDNKARQLTIKQVDIYSHGGGFYGNNLNKISIQSAKVRLAKGDQINNFASVALNDCSVGYPQDASFVKTNNVMELQVNGKKYTDSIAIVPPQAYQLWIADQQVTESNRKNLTQLYNVHGKSAYYEPERKILHLNNYTIDSYSGIIVSPMETALRSRINGLTIEIEDSCAITAYEGACMQLDSATTIIASAQTDNNFDNWYGLHYDANKGFNDKLSLSSYKDCIRASGELKIEALKITGRDFFSNSGGYLIRGTGSASSLYMRQCYVKNDENKDGFIGKFGKVNFYGCYAPSAIFAKDESGLYDLYKTSGMSVTDTKVTDGLIALRNHYPLWILGYQVNDDNLDGPIFQNKYTKVNGGKLSYDPSTKTLTFSNLDLQLGGGTTNSGNCDLLIHSEIPGLKIAVKGDNKVTFRSDRRCDDIASYKPMSIVGVKGSNGDAMPSLTFNHGYDNTGGFHHNSSVYITDSLYIGGLKLIFNDQVYGGIEGSSTSALIIADSADVTFSGDAEGGFLRELGNVTLDQVGIETPVNASFVKGSNGFTLCDADGNAVTSGTVHITPSAYSGIESMTRDDATTPTDGTIYTLTGIKLDCKFEDLPRGIYIVGGHKVIKNY